MIPLIPIVSALAAGGTLVPHAMGGFIVTGASGYVAGTFLSTSAVGWLIGTAGTFAAGAGLAAASLAGVGASAASVVGAGASAVVGSAGIAGTTVGATGLTAKLMAVGLISATPIAVPIAVAGGVVAAVAGLAFSVRRLRKKVFSTPPGEEAHFTEAEARYMQKLLLTVVKQPENVNSREGKPGAATGLDDERSVD